MIKLDKDAKRVDIKTLRKTNFTFAQISHSNFKIRLTSGVYQVPNENHYAGRTHTSPYVNIERILMRTVCSGNRNVNNNLGSTRESVIAKESQYSTLFRKLAAKT